MSQPNGQFPHVRVSTFRQQARELKPDSKWSTQEEVSLSLTNEARVQLIESLSKQPAGVYLNVTVGVLKGKTYQTSYIKVNPKREEGAATTGQQFTKKYHS